VRFQIGRERRDALDEGLGAGVQIAHGVARSTRLGKWAPGIGQLVHRNFHKGRPLKGLGRVSFKRIRRERQRSSLKDARDGFIIVSGIVSSF
jgi:hypothetical protein